MGSKDSEGYFLKYFNNPVRDMAARTLVEDTSSIGVSGFQEVLRREVLDRIMEESGIARESFLMEKLLKEIAVDSSCIWSF